MIAPFTLSLFLSTDSPSPSCLRQLSTLNLNTARTRLASPPWTDASAVTLFLLLNENPPCEQTCVQLCTWSLSCAKRLCFLVVFVIGVQIKFSQQPFFEIFSFHRLSMTPGLNGSRCCNILKGPLDRETPSEPLARMNARARESADACHALREAIFTVGHVPTVPCTVCLDPKVRTRAQANTNKL